MAQFVRIGEGPHTWDALVDDWRKQTEALGETFDEEYQLQPTIFKPLIERNDPRAGLFAIFDNDRYEVVCQLNAAALPGYRQPVMRVRFVTFGPELDLGNERAIDPYASALVETFFAVVKLSMTEGPMRTGHVNFHLPSPSDRQFFTFVGQRFKDRELFESVDSKGSWLYITL